MHTVGAEQLEQAVRLAAALRAEAGEAMKAEGYGNKTARIDYAASCIAAWADVARRRGEVRSSFERILEELRGRFINEWRLPVPACLSCGY